MSKSKKIKVSQLDLEGKAQPTENIPFLVSFAKGVKNAIYTGEAIKKLSEDRLAICKKCPAYTKHPAGLYYCSKGVEVKDQLTNKKVKGCGCWLKAKTRVPEEQCPANKWFAVNQTKYENNFYKNK